MNETSWMPAEYVMGQIANADLHDSDLVSVVLELGGAMAASSVRKYESRS